MDGVKEATIKIEGCTPDWAFLEGAELKVAIAHGLVNANKIMKMCRDGKAPYHFVEIMACPGGCIGWWRSAYSDKHGDKEEPYESYLFRGFAYGTPQITPESRCDCYL